MNGTLAFVVGVTGVGLAAWAARGSWLRLRASRRLGGEIEQAVRVDVRQRELPALAPAVLTGLLVALLGVGTLGLSTAIAAGAAFDLAALVYVGFSIRSRARSLRAEGQLSEALRLMTGALRAGSSPSDALDRAGSKVAAPTGPMLCKVAGRLRLGEDPDVVLGSLARDAGRGSVQLFAQALGVQWRAGGSLQSSLESVGRYVADRVELQRRIESQAAPTRASVLILAGATVAVGFLSWSNDPANVERFVASPTGEAGIALTLVLQGLSFLWMWHMARVDV